MRDFEQKAIGCSLLNSFLCKRGLFEEIYASHLCEKEAFTTKAPVINLKNQAHIFYKLVCMHNIFSLDLYSCGLGLHRAIKLSTLFIAIVLVGFSELHLFSIHCNAKALRIVG